MSPPLFLLRSPPRMLRVSIGALLLAGSASAFAPMPSSTRLGLRAPAASALSMAVQDVTDASQLDSIVKEAGQQRHCLAHAFPPSAAPETAHRAAHLGVTATCEGVGCMPAFKTSSSRALFSIFPPSPARRRRPFPLKDPVPDGLCRR